MTIKAGTIFAQLHAESDPSTLSDSTFSVVQVELRVRYAVYLAECGHIEKRYIVHF
jgi:hypothetical protein